MVGGAAATTGALVTSGSGVGGFVVGKAVGATESTSIAMGALDHVGSVLALGTTLALGAALVGSGGVEFVLGQPVGKARAGIKYSFSLQ